MNSTLRSAIEYVLENETEVGEKIGHRLLLFVVVQGCVMAGLWVWCKVNQVAPERESLLTRDETNDYYRPHSVFSRLHSRLRGLRGRWRLKPRPPRREVYAEVVRLRAGHGLDEGALA